MKRFLDNVALRLRLRRTLARAGWVLTATALLCGAWVATGVFIPLPYDTEIAVALLALGAIVSAGLFFTVRFSRAEAAQVADLVLGTQSLFVTAIDDGTESTRRAMSACQERAETLADETGAGDVVPLKFGARWSAAALPVAAAAAIWFAPMAPVPAPESPVNVEVAVEKLNKAADKLARGASPEDKARAERLRRLSRQLKKGALTRREALEELGDIKRQLRVEKLERQTAAARAKRGAQAASQSLGKGETTSQLSKELSRATSAETQAAREDAANKAKNELRELAKLERKDREASAKALEDAARKARAQGNEELAQALEAAAQAVRGGDQAAAEAAGDQLAQAMRNLGSGEGAPGQQRLEELDAAQAALGGGQLPSADGGDPREGEIAPGPRNWQSGEGPGNGQGDGAGAGTGHSDEETAGGTAGDKHQDADRFGPEATKNWDTEYKELYEAALLNSDGRIGTRVKGERSGDGKVQVVRGGQQAPRAEAARGAIEKLPVRYADEARKAVDGETVPPGYRDAVRDYFNAEK